MKPMMNLIVKYLTISACLIFVLLGCQRGNQNYYTYPPTVSQQNQQSYPYQNYPQQQGYPTGQYPPSNGQPYPNQYPEQGQYGQYDQYGNQNYATNNQGVYQDPYNGQNYDQQTMDEEANQYGDKMPTAPVAQNDVPGVWLVQSSKDNCRLSLTLTRWNNYNRANGMQCVGAGMKRVKGWSLDNGVVLFYDETGTPIGRVSKVATNRLQGKIESDGFLLLTR